MAAFKWLQYSGSLSNRVAGVLTRVGPKDPVGKAGPSYPHPSECVLAGRP